MARVIAPFKIQGTIGDLVFRKMQDGSTIVQQKGKTGVSSEVFKTHPTFEGARRYAKNWQYCIHKAKVFRMSVKHFFDRSKDGSFVGRVCKLFFDLLEEDLVNPLGSRTVENALSSPYLEEIVVGFEGNKFKKLSEVLRVNWQYDKVNQSISLPIESIAEAFVWPEGANIVHIGLATTCLDIEGNSFSTSYSEEISFTKEEDVKLVTLQTELDYKGGWLLTYLFIGFSEKTRRKEKPLLRKFNTVTVIHTRYEAPTAG